MPSPFARAGLGFALALTAALSSTVLAQAPPPAPPPAPRADAPRVYSLTGPLSPAAAAQLTAARVDVLHYYGRGRYLLSGRPPAALLTTEEPKASVANASARSAALHLSAFDAYPDLRADIAGGVDRRYEVEVVLAFAGADDYLGGAFAETGFAPLAPERPRSLSVRGTISAAQVPRLLAHDYVLDVGAAAEDVELLNDEARREHRVNVLHDGRSAERWMGAALGSEGAPDGSAARGLTGEGVVVGVGDGGKISDHPDVANRTVHSTAYYNADWGMHPDFVTGLIGAEGVVDPRFRGNAPAAKFVIDLSSNITYRAAAYYRDHGMTLTNNSYGPHFACHSIGRYYYQAATLDQQGVDRPEVLHVFAAGNSGGSACGGGAGSPYGTIIPGGQTAKNTLTVGNAHTMRARYRSSSAGPTFDGRLKPEIIAVGHNVVSNNRERSYSGGSGTSFSAPNVAGVLALLTEHHKRLRDGRQPGGDLLKAIACNTATDVGRPGPDFEHGFGLIDGVAAARAITEEAYVRGALAIGATAVQTLDVDEGREQLKVLLYWHDRPGATNNQGPALVDDLDLALVSPAGDTIRPWVLDARAPAAVATRGRDSVNNVEQVTLDAPAPGRYRLVVTSRRQAYGNTDYVLTWGALAPEVRLTQPLGGQSVDPGREIAIAWSGSPGQAGTWRVEYAALDDGATKEVPRPRWRVYERGLPNLTRSTVFDTVLPYGRYRFRVVNEGTGRADETTAAVTVLAPPAQLAAPESCGGSARLTWSPTDGAAGYEVYRYDGTAMRPVGTTAGTEFFVDGVPETGEALYTVAAIDAGGVRSDRARALFVARQLDGPCAEPVPVTWREVSVADEVGVALVRWSVEAEFENDYFEVERGEGSPAGLVWTAVGQVPGRGTANTPADYRLADPFPPAGAEVYYRVRQVDYDGSSETSSTVAYRSTATPGSEGAVVTLSQNTLHVSTVVNVPSGRGAVELEVFDIAGRRVRAETLSEGRHVVAWANELPAGAYVMRASSDGLSSTHRVVRP